MRGRGLLSRALRRFWAVALATGLVAGGASWLAISGLTSTTYTADGLFIVPTATASQSLAGSILPESPFEAEGLAQTYALLLVDDSELLGAISDATGATEDELRERTVAESVPSTPAIRVSYSGESEAKVRDYFTGLQEVVSTTGSSGLPAGNMRALSLPGEIEELSGLQPVAPLVALLAGLLVGVGGAVLLERSDRRVEGADDLRELTAWPVFDVRQGRGHSRLETAAIRLARSDHSSVVVVTTSASPAELTEVVTYRLHHLPAESPTTPAWVASGQLGTDGHAEQAVVESRAALLVVTPSTRSGVVDDALRALADTGVQDVVILLRDPVRAASTETSYEEDLSTTVFPDSGGPGTSPDAPTRHGARSVER